MRNCLLHLVPPDLVEDAIKAAKETLTSDAAKDPDEARKRLIRAFQGLGVAVADLEVYLGHPLQQITPDEIADLRGVYKSILDGNSVWRDHVADKMPPASAEDAPVTMDDLGGKQAEAAASPPESDAEATVEESNGQTREMFLADLAACDGIRQVSGVLDEYLKRFIPPLHDWAKQKAEERKQAIRESRGAASNKPADGKLFDTKAVEAEG